MREAMENLIVIQIFVIFMLSQKTCSDGWPEEAEDRTFDFSGMKFGKFGKGNKNVLYLPVPVPVKSPSKPQIVFVNAPAPKVSCPPKVITIPKTEYITVPAPAVPPKVVMIPSPPVPPRVVLVKSPPGPALPPQVIVVKGPPAAPNPPQVIFQKVPTPITVPAMTKDWR